MWITLDCILYGFVNEYIYQCCSVSSQICTLNHPPNYLNTCEIILFFLDPLLRCEYQHYLRSWSKPEKILNLVFISLFVKTIRPAAVKIQSGAGKQPDPETIRR